TGDNKELRRYASFGCDAAMLKMRNPRRTNRGNLIQAVHSMDYHRALAAKLSQSLCNFRAQVRIEYAYELVRCARGVAQRPPNVEHRSYTKFLAGLRCALDPRMVTWRIHKPNADRIDARTDLRRIEPQVHTQGSQHVRASAPARYRPITVLGYRDAC